MIEYVKCDAADIPADTAWDVPPRHQGQIVEIAYSRHPPSLTPATEGAPWQRIRDLSEGPDTRDSYYRLRLRRRP